MSASAPTAAQLQHLIVLEVGDADDKRLARNIGLLWSIYGPIGLQSPTLQYLYARRHAILMVMGAVREQVDINASGEVNVTHSQRIGNLEVMLTATQAEIDALAGGDGGGGGLLAGGAGTLDLAPTTDAGIPVANLNPAEPEPLIPEPEPYVWRGGMYPARR